ncbi:hypothetical protein GF312_03055 [Candidatus Poribacteria bacterium]|nr:hypothetical protein [Candidatus Poribacteria bacterium]
MAKYIILTFILLMTFSAFSYEVDENTVAIWRFDRVEGKKVIDASGNEHHGKIVGDANWITKGKLHGALEFNGNNSFVEVPKSKDFDLTEFTIELWFKAESLEGTKAVFGHGESFDTDIAQYVVEINDEENRDKIHLWYEAKNDNDTYVPSKTDIKTETWYFFAATRDKEGNIKVYLNGELETTAKQPVPSDSIDHIITIGCRTNDPTWKKYQDYFHGVIDEIRLSNIARSSEEIQGSFKLK